MSVITKQKAHHLLRLPEEVKACNGQLWMLRPGNIDMKI